MAPRGRSKKKGETRMDAALDAMSPYGFPNQVVRRTVNQLLKVYGGNEGWVFIEDSAYTLLIDTLLEKQTIASSQDILVEDRSEAGSNEASPTGCSNQALLPCSNAEPSADGTLTYQTVGTVTSAANGTGKRLPIKAVNTVSAIGETSNGTPAKPLDISPATTEPDIHHSIKVVDTALATKETGHQAPVKATNNESDCQPAVNSTLGAVTPAQSPQTKSTKLVGKLCQKRRRPCYGWISSDDENEEELVELPPAALSKVLTMLVSDRVN